MSVSFRVMRLLPPRPHVDTGVKLDLLQDTAAEGPEADGHLKFSELTAGLVPRHATTRTHAETYSDLDAPSDMLALPSSFGSCYLGEVWRRALGRKRKTATPAGPHPAGLNPAPAAAAPCRP